MEEASDDEGYDDGWRKVEPYMSDNTDTPTAHSGGQLAAAEQPAGSATIVELVSDWQCPTCGNVVPMRSPRPIDNPPTCFKCQTKMVPDQPRFEFD